jgi:hypothetical protein
MGFLSKIVSLLRNSGDEERGIYRTTVRCSRCGEEIPVRINLNRELTPQYGEEEVAYYVNKGVVGSGENRCFQTIDVHLTFDAQKRVISRQISGGAFVSEVDSLSSKT